MIADRLERLAFALVRGYDRTQLGAYVAEGHPSRLREVLDGLTMGLLRAG